MMTSLLLPWIGAFLVATPPSPPPRPVPVAPMRSQSPPVVVPAKAPTTPTRNTAGIPLRAHILEMAGIQWRADLLDGLEYVEQADGYTVWKVDRATLKRMVDASAECQPAGTAKGLGSATRIYYVASLQRTATVANGRTTSVAFTPAIGSILSGLELEMQGKRAQGGVLADVTIRNGRVESFHQVQRREEVGNGGPRNSISGTIQVPEGRQETVKGQWLIPAGGAVLVALGVHGHSSVLWGQDERREQVVVIDAGDVPASVYARPRQSPDPSWVDWLPPIDWPAALAGSLAAAFLAGWFVRGTARRIRARNSTAEPMETSTEPAPLEESRPSRSWHAPTLGDSMALVAGTAVACLIVQTAVGPIDPTELWDALLNSPASSWTALNVALVLGELGTLVLVPLLAVGSATLVLMVTCMPRADRVRLFLRPGVLASFQVSLVVLLIAGLGLVRYRGASQPGGVDEIVGDCSMFVAGLSGLAVAACWITLKVVGAWRPEASWVDRLGRLLGMTWIAILPFVLLYAFLMDR